MANSDLGTKQTLCQWSASKVNARPLAEMDPERRPARKRPPGPAPRPPPGPPAQCLALHHPLSQAEGRRHTPGPGQGCLWQLLGGVRIVTPCNGTAKLVLISCITSISRLRCHVNERSVSFSLKWTGSPHSSSPFDRWGQWIRNDDPHAKGPPGLGHGGGRDPHQASTGAR